jgi:mannosyltransferase
MRGSDTAVVTPAPVAGSAAVPLRPRRRVWDRLPGAIWDPHWDTRIVAVLVGVAFVLRVPDLDRSYWVDEGITIGIAGHPLSQIPGLLRHDGSPPLFYFLLHFWLGWFGTGEAATHTFSLLISLAVVVVAWWCGRTLGGRNAGIAAAALAATNPYLNWYATETRMYTLVVGMGLLAVTFTVRALRHRRVADAAGAVASAIALEYTHNWALYLIVVLAGLVAARALVDGDRALLRGAVVASAVVAIAYLPWLPSFMVQASTTAAPWAVPPGIGDYWADPSTLLGGTLGVIVLPALVFGSLWTRSERLGAIREGLGGRGASYGVGFLVAVAGVTVTLGWWAAQFDPSWTVRYLGVVLGPLLLAAAVALAATSRGRVVVVGVCVLCAAWAVIGAVLPNPAGRYAKSNVAAVAAAAGPDLHPGDLVVVAQTEQLAVLDHYLPSGLDYVTPTGPVADPTWVNWTDLVQRLQAADVCRTVLPAIAALPPGADVLEINPLQSIGASSSTWSKAANGKVTAIDQLLASQPSLVPTMSFIEGTTPKPFSAVVGELFVKQAGGVTCPG